MSPRDSRLRAEDAPDATFAVAVAYDPTWQPTAKWEQAVWKRLPPDGTRDAASYWEVVSVDNHPRLELCAALASLVSQGRARTWGDGKLALAARGANRVCPCGLIVCPGVCPRCGRTGQEAAAVVRLGGEGR